MPSESELSESQLSEKSIKVEWQIYYKLFQIIDRNNGSPIENANVNISYESRNNKNSSSENYTTNDLGEIKIKKDKESVVHDKEFHSAL